MACDGPAYRRDAETTVNDLVVSAEVSLEQRLTHRLFGQKCSAVFRVKATELSCNASIEYIVISYLCKECTKGVLNCSFALDPI